jgi:5'-deoxynucleotidase YfbR-like HD superfamily hydrolase
MSAEIQTISGRYFSLETLEANIIDIKEIAHALSHICRFTGHVRNFYSVAQHSVLVSQAVPHHLALHGLLHDAAEAYLGDVSRPLKMLLPDYKAIERRVESRVWRFFGLPDELPTEVAQVDDILLVTERRDLLPDNGDEWPSLKHVTPSEQRIVPWAPEYARLMFVFRFEELMAERARNAA